MNSVSFEKAKSAYISGNLLLCKEHLEHLRKQIYFDPPFDSSLDKKFDEMFNYLEKSKNHEKGLKLLKKLRKKIEKLNKGGNLIFDQIMRREQVENLFKDRNKLM